MAKSLNNFVRNPLMMRSRAFNMGWSKRGINKTVNGRFVGFNPLPSTGLIAHFDESTIVGDSIVTEWQNQGSGGAAFNLDLVAGAAGNLTRLGDGFARTNEAIDSFSTPDSALNSVTGDIDIRWVGIMDDWDTGAVQMFVQKFGGAPNRSYRMRTGVLGELSFGLTADGTLRIDVVSTVALPFSPGEFGGVRATWSLANQEVNFYTSTDGIIWTQLGIAVALVAAGIADGVTPVDISGASGVAGIRGAVKFAQVLDGIDGTLAVNFDPSIATQPLAAWTDEKTAAIWTPNGDAFVNTTGKDVVNSAGAVSIESTIGQVLTTPLTVFYANKITVIAAAVQNFMTAAKLNAAQSVEMSVGATALNQADAGLSINAGSADTDVHIGTLIHNADLTSSYEVSGLTKTVGTIGVEPWEFATLFASAAKTLHLAAWIGEVIVYDRALSISETEQVQGYLGNKWL